MTRLTDIADPGQILEMEPEELAPLVLRYLLRVSPGGRQINRYNFSLIHDDNHVGQIGGQTTEHAQRRMEAWMYLEREGFIAPAPGQQDEWAFVTRRGKAVAESQDFEAYRHSALFPQGIDPVFTQDVKPLFVRGDYDTAVFRAFKEVEIRVRTKASLSMSEFGVELMNRAFGPTGTLCDKTVPKPEQERMRDLFVGAIGTFKNPGSHRKVEWNEPREVIDVICFANQLLRIVDRS
jgi:uncharacterized protein (TIGR02391 family)